MYIGEPVVFNPENDVAQEKERIVTTLRNSMLNDYIKYECGKPAKNCPKLSRKRRK